MLRTHKINARVSWSTSAISFIQQGHTIASIRRFLHGTSRASQFRHANTLNPQSRETRSKSPAMRRAASSPSLSQPLRFPNDPSLSILAMAQTTARLDTFGPPAQQVVAAPSGSAWSPLIRWIENPLRLEALAIFTLSANAGLSDAEWRGIPMAVLRRSGEWHNIASHPHLRPAVTYVKQVISEVELKRAGLGEHAARGVEWFLLAQLAAAPGKPFMRDVQFVIAAPTQIGLVMEPMRPTPVREVGPWSGGLTLSPTDAVMPWEAVALAGYPWGVTAVALWTPLFLVTNPESIMQMLVLDYSSLGARSALTGIGARRVVSSYVPSVRDGVRSGLVVSLHRLHAEDIRMLLVNEAATTVPPKSDVWFTGIDLSLLHFCRDELVAWLEAGPTLRVRSRAIALTAILRQAQSKYLQAVEERFDDAGIVEGLAVASYEAKIRLCVSRSFVRLVHRLKRNDPVDSLLRVLREQEPSSFAEVLGIVMIDDEVLDAQNSKSEKCASAGVGSGAITDGTEWMSQAAADDIHQGLSELVRSEPRAQKYGIVPEPDERISEADDSVPKILSNRVDKVVWMTKRAGGYWRCLLPWILLTEANYDIQLGPSERGILVTDISTLSRKPKLFFSFEELQEEIGTRLKEDLLYVSRQNQTMPGSWLDPEVRASLILLIAGARDIAHMEDFSPCLQRLVHVVHDILYARMGDRLQDEEGVVTEEERASALRERSRRPFLFPQSRNCSRISPVPHLYLPQEVHCVAAIPSEEGSKKQPWIGIRWHEETILIAAGVRKNAVLHAQEMYVLACSNTFGLHSQDAYDYAGADSWTVGALMPNIVFLSPSNPTSRIDTPHIQLGAHSLELLWMAAERTLGAKIGILWTEGNGVTPAVVIRGTFDVLEEFATWVPGLQILGNGFTSPPALSNRKDRHYFSRGRRAVRLWSQDQVRLLLARKNDKLARELGESPAETARSRSSYLAHSVADCIVLYLHVKFGLPLASNNHVRRWALPLATAVDAQCGFVASQSIMLPISTALRVAGTEDVEIAVDYENKLVWKACHVSTTHHANNGLDEHFIQPTGSPVYERIATGTMEDSSFFKSGKRIYCGALESSASL